MVGECATLCPMEQRLPVLSPSTDSGYVYVVQRGGMFKLGFSRQNVARRVRDADGVLVLTIKTGQRPAQLEYLINKRFASKRLPPQGTLPGDKREWFALDDADLDWLRGLADHLNNS